VPSAFSLINLKGLGTTDTADLANVTTALQNNRCILMANAWYSPSNDVSLAIWFQQQAHVNGF
jgi:hypothetical protein